MISVGIDHWYRLKEYEPEESIYAELKLLGRQYQLLPYHKKISAEDKALMVYFISYTYMVLNGAIAP